MVDIEYRYGDVIPPLDGVSLSPAIRDAEGSTGQTSSSDDWDGVSESIRQLAVVRDARKLVGAVLPSAP